MQRKTLTIFGALLISGMAVQMAAASEHHRSKAYFGRDVSEFRRAYNQVNRPIYVITPRTPDSAYTDSFGLSGRDPSWVGDQDPSLHPAGN